MSDLNGDNNVDISPEQTQTEETNGPISESKSTENETKQTEKVVNESSPPQEKNGVSENSIPKPQKPKDGLKGKLKMSWYLFIQLWSKILMLWVKNTYMTYRVFTFTVPILHYDYDEMIRINTFFIYH